MKPETQPRTNSAYCVHLGVAKAWHRPTLNRATLFGELARLASPDLSLLDSLYHVAQRLADLPRLTAGQTTTLYFGWDPMGADISGHLHGDPSAYDRSTPAHRAHVVRIAINTHTVDDHTTTLATITPVPESDR